MKKTKYEDLSAPLKLVVATSAGFLLFWIGAFLYGFYQAMLGAPI